MSVIMIVDDDEPILQVAGAYLRALGHTPLPAPDSTQVFPILENNSVDLILLDVFMPDINGMELLQLIKSHPVYQNIPVIMLTGGPEEMLLAKCFELGATDFVSKPIKKTVLQSRIKMALAAREYIRQLADFNENLEKIVRQRTMELRESEERLQSILDNATAVVYLKDTQGRYLLINHRYEVLFHIKKDEISGKTDHDIFPEETADKFMANDRKALETLGPLEFEEEVPQDDGNHTYISMKFPLVDPLGVPYGVCGISTDITERKRIEEELLKLSRAVEQSPNSVIVTDIQGNIEYVNPKFSQLTGYTSQEVVGKNPRILKSGETPPEYYKRLWDTIVSGREWQGEFHNKKKNGDLFWESVAISSIKNTRGEATHFIAVKEDITEKKLVEEKERRQREQLAQADKMISLGTLVAGVAHEINNPNNNILLNVSSLKKIWERMKPMVLSKAEAAGENSFGEMDVGEGIRLFEELLGVTGKAGERIEKIVDGLKAFAREDTSGYQNKVDVGRMIESSVKLLESLIKKSANRFRCDIPPLPLVRGNFHKLEQVMVNLIINACQALEDPSQRIEVSAIHNEPEGMVDITVRDEGRGMDGEVLRRVMEPFFTTRQASDGTGLGVSISYGIIREHGGDMVYDSAPGKGTTVCVRLPVERE
ncbi:MAG: PAS domain S-box protein [Nitrospinae bacterium]|nr:PAS domain S-box protein [Nitrospinota bacterium]